MWRAIFLALGIFACILGLECLVIDRAFLIGETAQQQGALFQAAGPVREFKPPEWAPWSLLSSGAVVILYSFTLPRFWSS